MQKIFLLADDDADDRDLFTDALKEVDPLIFCHIATDGKKVLQILGDKKLGKPQIIFLDVNMPRKNGWECLKSIKNNEAIKAVPVLMYSTSSHERDINMAMDLGALCFFTKPNGFKDLKAILDVIAANLNENLLDAISHFNHIKAK